MLLDYANVIDRVAVSNEMRLGVRLGFFMTLGVTESEYSAAISGQSFLKMNVSAAPTKDLLFPFTAEISIAIAYLIVEEHVTLYWTLIDPSVQSDRA